jgi:hypothetical protein
MNFPTSSSFNNLFEILKKTERDKMKAGYFTTRLIKLV